MNKKKLIVSSYSHPKKLDIRHDEIYLPKMINILLFKWIRNMKDIEP